MQWNCWSVITILIILHCVSGNLPANSDRQWIDHLQTQTVEQVRHEVHTSRKFGTP